MWLCVEVGDVGGGAVTEGSRDHYRHGSYKESRYSLRTTAKQSKFKRESGYTLEGLQRLAYMSSQDFSRISVEADDHSGE